MSRAAFLSPADVSARLYAAQDVERTVERDDEGAPRFVYASTPASERALDELYRAFEPAIRRASSKAIRVTREEAASAATEAFMNLARTHDPEKPEAFGGVLREKAWQAVYDADLAAVPVKIEHSAFADYRRLMKDHDEDPALALAAASLPGSRISSKLFLAVHRVTRGVVSLEALADEDAEAPTPVSARTPSPEDEVALRQLVAWLFEHVTDQQESIFRLRHGFLDDATVNLCFSAGLPVGDLASDASIGVALGMGRSTVNTAGRKGMDALRAAIAAEAE